MIIADSWTSKANEILAARPDLVIAAVPYQEEAVAEILKAGIRFLGLAPRTLDDIYTDIAMIAGCVGAGERGAQVISDMQAAIEDVRRTDREPAEKARVLRGVGQAAHRVAALGGGTGAMRRAANFWARRARSTRPKKSLDWTRKSSSPPGAGLAIACRWQRSFAKEAGLTLAAVRNSQVYCISDELLNTPAPTLVAGLQALAGGDSSEQYSVRSAGLRSITASTADCNYTIAGEAAPRRLV